MVPGWDETLDGLQSSGEDRDRHWLVPGRRAGGQAEPPASQSCSPQHVWVRMPVPLRRASPTLLRVLEGDRAGEMPRCQRPRASQLPGAPGLTVAFSQCWQQT